MRMKTAWRIGAGAVALLPAAWLLCQTGCLGGFDEPRSSGNPRQVKATTDKADAPSGTRGEDKKSKKPPEQTYSEAWQLICEAEQRSGADVSKQNRAERGATVANWIVSHLKNRRARYWFISFGKVDRAQREAAFRREARQAGIKHCALADLLSAPHESKPATDGGPTNAGSSAGANDSDGTNDGGPDSTK